MYHYHQKLSDSNKRNYINLCSGNSLFSNNLGSSFSQSQKSSKALITISLIIPDYRSQDFYILWY